MHVVQLRWWMGMAQESILATERSQKKRSLREIADTKHRVSAPAGEWTVWEGTPAQRLQSSSAAS